MKEKPIIFNSEMVRGILEDRKFQTRRIIKPQPISGVEARKRLGNAGLPIYDTDWEWHDPKMPGNTTYSNKKSGPTGWVEEHSPYGQPGDHLWVRETFFNKQWPKLVFPSFTFYKADHPADATFKWRPSLHMPKVFSRITLEITNVRVERLQDISNEDIWAEGNICKGPVNAMFWFSQLWNKINGPGAWDKNPWVWVIEFRRVV